jgi:hypothetical protein
MKTAAQKQEKERRRISVVEAVDEINMVKNAVTAIQEMSPGEGPYSKEGKAGLFHILGTIYDDLNKITEAEIVPDGDQKESIERRDNRREIERVVMEADRLVRVLDGYVDGAQEISPSEAEKAIGALFDTGEMLEQISGKMDALMKLTGQA